MQDLTQPYHATAAPNVPFFKLILAAALDKMGSHTLHDNIIHLIGNRHFSLEDYEYNLIKTIMTEKNWQENTMIQAIMNEKHDANYPVYSDTYPSDIVSSESNAMADVLDSTIRVAFPKKYVADLNYEFYVTEPDVDLLTVAMKNPNPNIQLLNNQLTTLLAAFGSHTRNMVRYATQPSSNN